MLNYLAYGSNLHPVRLSQRVPSARLIGSVSLRGYRVKFNKLGADASAKCNLVAGETNDPLAFAALYQIDASHKPDLDRYEGVGNGYIDRAISVQHEGQALECFTYFAQDSHLVKHLRPFHWYKKLVELGASHCRFPHWYITQFKTLESMADPDPDRSMEMETLIRKILKPG